MCFRTCIFRHHLHITSVNVSMDSNLNACKIQGRIVLSAFFQIQWRASSHFIDRSYLIYPQAVYASRGLTSFCRVTYIGMHNPLHPDSRHDVIASTITQIYHLMPIPPRPRLRWSTHTQLWAWAVFDVRVTFCHGCHGCHGNFLDSTTASTYTAPT